MSYIFAQKTNRAFYQTVFTVIAAIAAMALLSLKVFQASSLYFQVLIHKIKDACGCTDMAQFFSMHPDIFRAIILFGIGIGVFILYSLYKLIKLHSQTKKYIAHFLSSARTRHSAKLKAALKALSLDKRNIVEINNSEPIVFCFGFWQPKICISRELINMLDTDELKAVLKHEAEHMISYAPLKVFIIKYVRSIFFFLPGIKSSAKKYITFSELAADEHASRSAAERSSLASAILKISEQEEYLRQNSNSSLSYFDSAIYERVNRLTDETYIPKFKFLDRSLIVGSLGLAFISLILIFVFSNSTKAFEMHHISNCIPGADSTGSDSACAALSTEQNVFNASDNNFLSANTAGIDFKQHSACEAE